MDWPGGPQISSAWCYAEGLLHAVTTLSAFTCYNSSTEMLKQEQVTGYPNPHPWHANSEEMEMSAKHKMINLIKIAVDDSFLVVYEKRRQKEWLPAIIWRTGPIKGTLFAFSNSNEETQYTFVIRFQMLSVYSLSIYSGSSNFFWFLLHNGSLWRNCFVQQRGLANRIFDLVQQGMGGGGGGSYRKFGWHATENYVQQTEIRSSIRLHMATECRCSSSS